MEPAKILIVEDGPIVQKYLKNTLEDFGFEVLGVAGSVAETKELLKVKEPDMVLLDIELEGPGDGIDMARELNEHYKLPFIFITSHDESDVVQRAKEVHPAAYLTKPFKDSDVLIAIEMALNNLSRDQGNDVEASENVFLDDCLFIRDKKLFVKVKYKDIIWLKADGGYTEIHTAGKRMIVRNVLKDVEEKLPSDKFVRIHRSYVIRLDAIAALNSQSVYLEDDTHIPISRNTQSWLMTKLNLLTSQDGNS